jgi:BirA family transcriptional regulator, biotin operon repressor / biotin---[acetyl-CoA-carboxylase] ligase
MSEPLPEDFAAALASSADRRGAFGQSVVFQSSTRSTNDVAQALAEGGAPHGTVAVAFAQTAGRGRQGREWFSPPGAGIYMSVVVRSAAVAPMLTLAGGVAVAEGIRQATGLPVLIKWPNDVVVEDERAPGRRRKLAGILAEGSTGQSGLQHVVMGIGINVRPADYPPELAARVTSLEHELGRAVDAGLVLSEILVALNEQMGALEAGCREQVLSRWRSLAPSASGTRVSWNDHGVTLSGVTAGVDQRGALLIRTGSDIQRVISGEVLWD